MPFPYPKIIDLPRFLCKHRQINCRETALPFPDFNTGERPGLFGIYASRIKYN